MFRNLVPPLARRGLRVDLLTVEGHGPDYGDAPPGVRQIPLGTRHVHSALVPLVRYLRRERPRALLTDKDRVNRVALLARALARTSTRIAVRLGTTVSVNLASRGPVDRWLQVASMRGLYRRADAVLVPSRGAAEDLIRHARLPTGLVHVVPSPVVDARLHALAAEPPPHDWFADGGPAPILGVGELSERKDFATLLRAFARCRAARPAARLVVLGEGRRRAELEQLARALGVADAVALPGFVANPYACMARAAAFVLCSRWEGMPVVLIEALALGTPSAACDCPSGPREILAGGRYGPLVPVGDDAALATAIGSLLDHPLPRSLLMEAARGYTVEASATAYLAALGLETAA